MTIKEQIIDYILNRCSQNFALCASSLVIKLDGVEELYLLATDKGISHTKREREAILFRSAYTLEYIYFNHNKLFTPFLDRFITDYPLCKNQSAKRHFTKMMSDILKSYKPSTEHSKAIAEATINWIIEPKAKVAVKVWAMSVLSILKQDNGWIDEVWEDLEATMQKNATPGIQVRIRRNWQ